MTKIERVKLVLTTVIVGISVQTKGHVVLDVLRYPPVRVSVGQPSDVVGTVRPTDTVLCFAGIGPSGAKECVACSPARTPGHVQCLSAALPVDYFFQCVTSGVPGLAQPACAPCRNTPKGMVCNTCFIDYFNNRQVSLLTYNGTVTSLDCQVDCTPRGVLGRHVPLNLRKLTSRRQALDCKIARLGAAGTYVAAVAGNKVVTSQWLGSGGCGKPRLAPDDFALLMKAYGYKALLGLVAGQTRITIENFAQLTSQQLLAIPLAQMAGKAPCSVDLAPGSEAAGRMEQEYGPEILSQITCIHMEGIEYLGSSDFVFLKEQFTEGAATTREVVQYLLCAVPRVLGRPPDLPDSGRCLNTRCWSACAALYPRNSRKQAE